MQEKSNSIVFKVRSFVSLCWYQNDESQSQVDDSGAKSLPQEWIRDDEHAGKQIKQTIQVNKQITRRSRFHRFINPSQHRAIYKSRERAVSRIPAMQLKRIFFKTHFCTCITLSVSDVHKHMERADKNFKLGHSDLTLLGRNKDRRFIALWL